MPQSADPITTAALRAGVDPALLRLLVGKESGGRDDAVSPKGARGKTQLMPGTARALEQRYKIDTSTPEGNLAGGAYYLREQLDRFKRPDLALSAYNSGPGGSEASGRVEGFGETQDYVKTIMSQYKGSGRGPAKSTNVAVAAPQANVEARNLGEDPRRAVLLSLLAQRRSGSEDRSPVIAALSAMHQQPPAQDAAHATQGPAGATHTDPPDDDWRKWVGVPEKRTGPSASHRPEILQFVGKVGGIAKTRLTPWGNESHSLTTVHGNRSAHADGHAADIPATGAELVRLGQAALIAAGMPPEQARKQKGGLFNVGGHQIIFATNEGGNHHDHVHVGIRR